MKRHTQKIITISKTKQGYQAIRGTLSSYDKKKIAFYDGKSSVTVVGFKVKPADYEKIYKLVVTHYQLTRF